jgi:hypothetical protein
MIASAVEMSGHNLAFGSEGRKGVAQRRVGDLHQSSKRLAQLQDQENRTGG